MNAMDDAAVTKVAGENGCAELASTSDPRVDLFFALVRDLPKERMGALVSACLADSRASPEVVASDLIVMAMQTRNCRGGKGEKGLFQNLFMELYGRFPQTMVALLPLLPEYGCFKDLSVLAAAAAAAAGEAEATAPVRAAALQVMADVLRKDKAELDKAEAEGGRQPRGLSLLGKWAPRESRKNKASSAQAKELAVQLFGADHAGRERAEYRKLVARLNRALGTVEVKMCGAAWGEIEPSAVPSMCMMKQRKAFLNEKVDGAPGSAERETGNRHPEDEDRVACRKRLRACLLEEGMKKLKGKQLHPHEIVQKLMGGYGVKAPSDMELEIFDAQWDAIRAETKASLERQAAEASAAASADDSVAKPAAGGGVNLGQLVPLVDVSGSMGGTPMEVAIALGILVSELTDPAFANRLLTFESAPRWFKLEEGATIAQKVRATQQAPWGGSTNFEAALERILEVCVSAKLTPDQIPDMLVLSDMQFDQARGRGGRWETQYERIVRRFAESGVKVCGEPWPAPTITFWNLRGTTSGFPASADQSGVRLLSGFSPALLKLLLDGGAEAEEEEVEVVVDGKVVVQKVKRKPTPLETLRKCLDDGQYDPVREVLSASAEGALAAYSFTRPAEEEAAAAVVPGAAGGGAEGNGMAVEEDEEDKGDEETWEEVEAP